MSQKNFLLSIVASIIGCYIFKWLPENFLAYIAASVIGYYICEWLNGNGRL